MATNLRRHALHRERAADQAWNLFAELWALARAIFAHADRGVPDHDIAAATGQRSARDLGASDEHAVLGASVHDLDAARGRAERAMPCTDGAIVDTNVR